MTSERQRAANRANAKKSTGLRSRVGKAITRFNARLHGLAASIRSAPGADEDIKILTQAIIAGAGRPDLEPLSRAIAEAEIDLRRIWRARNTLDKVPLPPRNRKWVSVVTNPKFFAALSSRTTAEDLSIAQLDELLNEARPQLVEVPVQQPKDRRPEMLDRYERRPLSRRKSAIRAFDAAQLADR